MDELTTSQGLLSLAQEIKVKMQAIVSGELSPSDISLHRWASNCIASLSNDRPGDLGHLLTAIESCLVDILSCEDADWDTPTHAFQEDLSNLDSAISVFI